MNRRQLIRAASSAAAGALIGTIPSARADSLKVVPYSREAFDQALASGDPLLLDFYAAW